MATKTFCQKIESYDLKRKRSVCFERNFVLIQPGTLDVVKRMKRYRHVLALYLEMPKIKVSMRYFQCYRCSLRVGVSAYMRLIAVGMSYSEVALKMEYRLREECRK